MQCEIPYCILDQKKDIGKIWVKSIRLFNIIINYIVSMLFFWLWLHKVLILGDGYTGAVYTILQVIEHQKSFQNKKLKKLYLVHLTQVFFWAPLSDVHLPFWQLHFDVSQHCKFITFKTEALPVISLQLLPTALAVGTTVHLLPKPDIWESFKMFSPLSPPTHWIHFLLVIWNISWIF